MNVYKIEIGTVTWWVVARSQSHAISRVEGVDDAFLDGEAVVVRQLRPWVDLVERMADGTERKWTAESFAEARPDGLLCSEF